MLLTADFVIGLGRKLEKVKKSLTGCRKTFKIIIVVGGNNHYNTGIPR